MKYGILEVLLTLQQTDPNQVTTHVLGGYANDTLLITQEHSIKKKALNWVGVTHPLGSWETDRDNNWVIEINPTTNLTISFIYKLKNYSLPKPLKKNKTKYITVIYNTTKEYLPITSTATIEAIKHTAKEKAALIGQPGTWVEIIGGYQFTPTNDPDNPLIVYRGKAFQNNHLI